MLRWIRFAIMFAAVAGVVWGIVRLYRRNKKRIYRAVGVVPDHWNALANASAKMREALDLRELIQKLIEQRQYARGDELLDGIDELLEHLSSLVGLDKDLSDHMSGLEGGEIGPDRMLPPASDPSIDENALTSLAGHRERLQGETSQAVADLRQIYLDLLEGMGAASIDGELATERAKRLASDVRMHAEAEKEVRDYLDQL